VTGRRDGRAQGRNPLVAYGFHRGGRHLGPPDGVAFREATSKVDLGRSGKTQGAPDLALGYAGDPGARSANE